MAGNSDRELIAPASSKKHATRPGRARGIGSGWFVSIVIHGALVFAVSRFVASPVIEDEPEVVTVLDLRTTNFAPRAEPRVVEAHDLARSELPQWNAFEIVEPDPLGHDIEATLADGAHETDSSDVIATPGGVRSSTLGSAMSRAKLPKRIPSAADALASGGAGSPAGPDGRTNERPTVAVLAPELIDSPAIEYPARSRRAVEEGQVKCRMHVTAVGLVEEVEVLVSSGFSRLDEAARLGLAKWKFKAGTCDGLACASLVDHVVTFRLTRAASSVR